MSAKDLQRIEVSTKVLTGRRSVASAATVLAISDRQVNRHGIIVGRETVRKWMVERLGYGSRASNAAPSTSRGWAVSRMVSRRQCLHAPRLDRRCNQ